MYAQELSYILMFVCMKGCMQCIIYLCRLKINYYTFFNLYIFYVCIHRNTYTQSHVHIFWAYIHVVNCMYCLLFYLLLCFIIGEKKECTKMFQSPQNMYVHNIMHTIHTLQKCTHTCVYICMHTCYYMYLHTPVHTQFLTRNICTCLCIHTSICVF